MSNPSGGVKIFSVQGRLYRERERLLGMTDEERSFRHKFLKDQILAHDEPRFVPELYKEQNNIIRRAYRFPLDFIGSKLEPFLGKETAQGLRIVTGKLLMGIALIYVGAYYFKYNANDWTRKGGVRVLANKPSVLPGDPDFPKVSERTVGADYASNGFKNSPI